MEEKFTAVYLMVRSDELKPEDGGAYEGPLQRQKEECLQFLKEKVGAEGAEPIEVYTRMNQLLMDVERHRIKRLVVKDLDRLGNSEEEVQAMLFELRAEGIEVMTVKG